MKLRSLDLFSGIGGISLALKDYAKTVMYCEIERYPQSVLLSRMLDGTIETAPIFRDVTRLDGKLLKGKIDIIAGGFPCQDISVAGMGAGLEGKRSGLFYEIIRLTEEIKPLFVFLENVPAIRTRGLDVVLKEFTALGYDCRWTTLSAASVGAPHKRERWFLLAHASGDRHRIKDQQGGSSGKNWERSSNTRSDGQTQLMANPNCLRKLSEQRRNEWISDSDSRDVTNTMRERLQGHRELRETSKEKSSSFRQSTDGNITQGKSWWAVEPSVGRVVNGIPNRVDRIKCLGNSVVPLQVKTAFEKLMGL